jgi:hypothetical protein
MIDGFHNLVTGERLRHLHATGDSEREQEIVSGLVGSV